MNRRRSKQNGEETAGVGAAADEISREEAVEELDEALDALPVDDAGEGAAAGVSDDNPLTHVDVSGETSFDSAEFEAEDEEAEASAEASAEFSEDEDSSDEDDEEGEDEDDEGSEDDDDEDEDDDDEESEFVIHDADAEDRAEELERMRAETSSAAAPETSDDEIAPGGQPRELAELVSICEALIFVSEDPLPVKAMSDILGEDKGWVQVAVEELAKEFNERNGGLMLREVAGGWQFATRPEHHEHVRAYLKSKPSAKLSLAALETLAVIAYKQPVTVPEILEIRGVQSSSAIKTLLDKRLIVAKGRKETVGRPMMYGTSKDFLLQFGLKDLSELPNVEDFEDLAGGGEIEK
ncbi:MAG TPA: SMC-Scp complex subunit ScpB [Pyrinomonadaceae bacterium]|nr:SMC-Scp complex subunit ScpB [Pyrinomonadaceae bacterium]